MVNHILYKSTWTSAEVRFPHGDILLALMWPSDWLTGNHSAVMTWSTSATDASILHELSLQTPLAFSTYRNLALDSSVWLGMLNSEVCSVETSDLGLL